MDLLLPKIKLPPDTSRNKPLFFLAGPTRGSGDWRFKMTGLLIDHFGSDIIVVNPSRYERFHLHYQYRVDGSSDGFARQTDWERYYLRQAAEKWGTGCIIFWLGCEDESNPRMDGSPYARETYGEVGEWRGHLMYNRNLRVVMGAEPDFKGLSQIARNFELALGADFVIHSTMEEVVKRASFFVHAQLPIQKTRI